MIEQNTSLLKLNNNGNDKPLVTIIIPAYNHEQYLEQSLLSAINQTYENLEIIVIDDGSTDNTAEVIEKLISADVYDRAITFIRQSNQGLSKTLNKALNIAKGEFVQFLASDDAYLPEKTTVCVQALIAAGENVAAVYSDGYLINHKNEKIMRFSDKYLRPLSSSTHNELLLGNWIPALGLLYKTSAIKLVGGFDENLAVEDYDLLLRITKKYELKSVTEKLFLYRWHENNFSKNQERMKEQLSLIMQKHQDLHEYKELVTAFRSFSFVTIIKKFSLFNVNILFRSLIRKIQTKYAIQNVSYFDLVVLLVQKGTRLAKAKINRALVSFRGIQIGKGAKVYGRIKVVGNKKNIHIGDGVVILGDVNFVLPYSYAKDQIYIGDSTVLDNNSTIFSFGGDIRIGAGCFIGPNTVIQANGDVIIGDFTMIASNSSIYANNHTSEINNTPFKFQGNKFIGITIGDNCWVGTGVSILDGSIVGNNSVIGAGCVVKGIYQNNALIVAKAIKGKAALKFRDED